MDIINFLVNKAKEEGYEEIYHNLVDVDDEKLYKDIGIEFSPSYRYELKLD